jgi:hypothetical protein
MFEPRSGKSVAGVITYMQRVPNYREYFAVRLSEPLTVGKKYRLTFHVSCGNKFAVGVIGASGLGACLTTTAPEQWVYEPLTHLRPQAVIEEVVHHTGWKAYSFTLEASEAYEYLTFGNFFPDPRTKVYYYAYDIDPQAYYYIDDVLLTEADALPTKEVLSPEAQQQTTADATEPPAPLEVQEEGKRKLDEQGIFRTTHPDIRLSVRDEREVDGDIISLFFNGVCVLKNYSLRKKNKKIRLRYEAGKDNLLLMYAHNLGASPPNTATITLSSNGRERQYIIRADLNTNAAIRIVEEE